LFTEIILQLLELAIAQPCKDFEQQFYVAVITVVEFLRFICLGSAELV
jgi:hypothetical protein